MWFDNNKGISMPKEDTQIQEDDFVEPVKDEKEDQEKSIRVDNKLYTYSADFTLEVLVTKLNSGEVYVPPFQRKYVWDRAGASKLIESFMRNLPIPPVYLFTNPENKYLIIDGHQRLITVKRFLEKIWEGQEEFRLILNEESEFNNKTYGDFSETEQRRFKNCVLRAVILEPKVERSDEALYDMFERLNTGGNLLKPQEIRNCVYHGKFNDALYSLNKLPEWRKIIGVTPEDNRQRDVELILRGITLYHLGETIDGGVFNYKPSLKAFLNNFMKTNQNSDEAWITGTRTLFTNTVKEILRTLDEKPFHLRRAMNAAAFDAVFVAYARNLKAIPSNIKQRYEKLKMMSAFRDYTEDRPTSEKSVNGRIALAEKTLFGR
jgi:hypothetical protein